MSNNHNNLFFCLCIVFKISCSVFLSKLLVASSNIKMLGSWYNALAIANLCLCHQTFLFLIPQLQCSLFLEDIYIVFELSLFNCPFYWFKINFTVIDPESTFSAIEESIKHTWVTHLAVFSNWINHRKYFFYH